MNEKTKKIIIIVVSILIVILFILSVMKKMTVVEEDLTEEQKLELIVKQNEERRVNKIAQMTERERIEYYFSEFIDEIENKEYENAYNMLSQKFKDNYFKDLNTFEEYAKSHFPNEIAIEYNNIERNGSLYVLWITMSNPIAVDKNSAKEMNVIIQENDVGEFEMSFSVEQ